MTCFPAKLGLSVSFVKKEWQIRLEAYNADCVLALLLPGLGPEVNMSASAMVLLTLTGNLHFFFFSGRTLDD